MKKFLIEFPFFCTGFVPVWVFGLGYAESNISDISDAMVFGMIMFVVASFVGRFAEAVFVDLLRLKRFMK